MDEVAPRFGGVGFGSTIREVERLLGKGDTKAGFAPVGRSPPKSPCRSRFPTRGARNINGRRCGGTRTPRSSSSETGSTRSFSPAPTSRPQGVGIGDSIDELRGSYDDAECKGVAGDESLTGGINTSYPSCRVQAASTRSVVFGGDPIRSITFYSNAPLG